MPPEDDCLPADAAVCPLCAAPNRCALERQRASGIAQPPCWCASVEFDAALLARIPARDRRLRCVCANCAARRPSDAPRR